MSAVRKQNRSIGFSALAILVSGAAGACTDAMLLNKPPIARLELKVADMTVTSGALIPYSGSPIEITLDGSKSTGQGSDIAEYIWIRTDLPRSARFADAGAGDTGVVPFEGTLENKSVIKLRVERGTYRFTLWAKDNHKPYPMVSVPVSVVVNVNVPPVDAGPVPDAGPSDTGVADTGSPADTGVADAGAAMDGAEPPG